MNQKVYASPGISPLTTSPAVTSPGSEQRNPLPCTVSASAPIGCCWQPACTLVNEQSTAALTVNSVLLTRNIPIFFTTFPPSCFWWFQLSPSLSSPRSLQPPFMD